MTNKRDARNPHLAYATTKTRTGKPNMTNRKPYRTAEQKAEARSMARKVGGTWVSHAPTSFSAVKKFAA